MSCADRLLIISSGSICVCQTPLGQRKDGMIAYLLNHQQEDGGWGLHIESPSSMFGTVMSYTSLRILGLPADHPAVRQAHAFMMQHGGAVMAPSWCKFWLAVLGLYDWDGINSIPAEMWLLPRWFPFHPGKPSTTTAAAGQGSVYTQAGPVSDGSACLPVVCDWLAAGRLWCHCRMVYLPMCYLYCRRFCADAAKDPLLSALREELYTVPYEKVDWDGERHSVSPLDEYDPVTRLMKVLQNILAHYERRPFMWLRNKGLQFAIDYIHAEDLQTNYVDIGPVNKVGQSPNTGPADGGRWLDGQAADGGGVVSMQTLNMLCVFEQGGRECEAFKRHVGRLDDYLWVAEDGMKMQASAHTDTQATSTTTDWWHVPCCCAAAGLQRIAVLGHVVPGAGPDRGGTHARVPRGHEEGLQVSINLFTRRHHNHTSTSRSVLSRTRQHTDLIA